MTPDSPSAANVLANYPTLRPEIVESLGGAGGFSGASLWKITSNNALWCLKAWPPVGISRERLAQIHVWMDQARSAGLSFVPAIARTADGSTIAELNGRLWELGEWMPGKADFHVRPTSGRIAAACMALARLHRVWQDNDHAIGEPPSIERRIRVAADWAVWISAGWKPRFAPSSLDPVSEVARSAWDLLTGLVPTVGPMLAPWIGRRFPLHPCLCDIWHDHVLYASDDVTGIIDYGSMRLDHRATDLARLLGDLAGKDESLYDAGLTAYACVIPISNDDIALIRALDRTGTILAAANWLRRLYRDGQPFDNRFRVAQRLRTIVGRLSDPCGFHSGKLH